MAKRELDNLDLDMIRCKADGFGCHYGHWKAIHGDTKVANDDIAQGWSICKRCGKAFKPKSKRPQKYCEIMCQQEASRERRSEKTREYYRVRMAKKRAERKLKNEMCTG